MNKRRLFQNQFPTVALLGTLIFSVLSCSDDNFTDNQESGDKGATVTFNVSSAQDEMLLQQQDAPAAPITRAAFSSRLAEQGLTMDDLASQKFETTNNAGLDVCLIETTVEGVNPIQPSADTRANIKTSIDARFTTSAYRSTSSSFYPSVYNNWFHNKSTNANGILVEPLQWEWNKPRYARFYSVFPEAKTENGMTFSSPPQGQSGTPYVDFEVNKNVAKQKDLMTACSGVVYYATRYSTPRTELKFRHALTAVRFAVGENLSWNKKIDKVEIRNAVSKGRYILPTEVEGTKGIGRWDNNNYSPRDNFTLEVPAPYVSTSDNPNAMLMGKNNDNFTFYMIPQTLTNKNVVVYVHCTDNTTITATLKGVWKPGTTKTYKLSQNNSSWEYVITTDYPNSIEYNQTTGNYSVTSYRRDPSTGVQHAVKWKIVSYQESIDGGITWSTESATKPTWLTGLTTERGNGGTAAESGIATVRKDIIDNLTPYNNILKNANKKGNSGNYYNLSNANGTATIENTANCYLISAPGHYRLPLVYGNAITGSAPNPNSYKTTETGTDILQHFKDHNNINIISPYINVQNAANPARQAGIVWADQSGLIKPSSLSVVGTGQNSFVQFEVTRDGIKNGNAVIAVKDAYGTIMWSWHIWFDHSDALNKIACTNFQGKVYSFSKNNLGFAVLKWEKSNYDKPRITRIKVEQEIRNGGVQKTSYIIIRHNSGGERKMISTLYQWGRKDAVPNIKTVAEGNYNIHYVGTHETGMTIQNGIRNPGTFYTGMWHLAPPIGYNYINLWSMNNTEFTQNDNIVIKTIYDPSPVGFKMPASNAFTGFSKTGQNIYGGGPSYVNGTWNDGWYFNNKLNSPDATIYFPPVLIRDQLGAISSEYYDNRKSTTAVYWTAIPISSLSARVMSFSDGYVKPLEQMLKPYALPIRPVADE